MSQYYIIDGYNMLHAIPSLQEMLDLSLENARKQLEQMVELYCRSGNIDATIVYDSRTMPDVFDHYQNFQQPTVVFAGSGKSADDFIITEAEKKGSKDTTVISNDKIIRENASRAGCLVDSPENFFGLLNKKVGKSGNKPKNYRQDELNREEIKEWIDLFKKKN
ncbi:MAG: hypothetical protein GF372_06035 [Candidatus Marinimicrobia bacterium]|nr:hypothetical protein [Candidatus Neomarinimicrobiota bacterium]